MGNDGSGSDNVQCHTDLSTCHGDWYFPNGDRLPFSGDSSDIVRIRQAQGVNLRCSSGIGSSIVVILNLLLSMIMENVSVGL